MKLLRWFAPALPVALTAASAVLAPTSAVATAPVNVDAVVINQSTVDGVDYITKRITIQPGGSTGWHYHEGRTFGVVREGTLTCTLDDCTEVVDPTGAAVTEGSGPEHAHNGRNLGTVPVVLWVDYILPAGTPTTFDVPPPPGCPV
ncbi:cupin [Mycolicibacterium moriokaense]|uniref:Cupin n=1 Tax=Mycolicibacterium moriokaense TaxID=39691 RepID=A0AAD1M5C1_9MYCO|nr:cupin domain-containing protein [Mycolicibacterium moriokaense]MCV7040879.1 cupin domain-containing protein [Mycolicibacterium moriokaense]ORB21559.1 cupin [Mycolicibacterium moriokaense]BBX00436.1 cupin [Mycolicibacterium moriokaense]